MIKFYFCEHCKNVVESVIDKNVPVCCGQPMKLIQPNTVDASKEKHVPEVSFEKGEIIVHVGSAAHPMTEEHLINFVELETTKGCYRHNLTASDSPVARFLISDDEDPVAVYAYCNLHGLWSSVV